MRKKGFRRGFATAGFGKYARRKFEVDIGVVREAEQTGGGIVGRPIVQVRSGAVIKYDAHVRKALGHTDRLRNRRACFSRGWGCRGAVLAA